MIKAGLVNPKSKERLFSCKPWEEYKAPSGDEEILIVEDYVTAFSTFQSVTRSTGGTTTIVTPRGGGSVSVTDVVVAATKVNNATVSLVFDDDTNSETLFTLPTNNQPVTFAWSVKGRMQGWRDARLDLVTVNSTLAFVTVTYMLLPDSLVFAEWDALR